VALRMPYLRVVGMQEEAEGAHGTPDFTCAPNTPQRVNEATADDC